VAIKSKFKYLNIIYLWLQVVFYTVLIAFVAALVLPNVGKAEVIDAVFPVSNRLYWYFTAYFCIYFFTPIINKGFEFLTNKQLKAIGFAIFGLFCIIPILADKDTFHLNNGYTPIWLLMLYIFGGIINTCNLYSKLKAWTAILLYLLMVVLTWGERLICDYLNANVSLGEPAKIKLTSYTAPTVLFAAVFLFIGFSKLKRGKISAKLIALFAPASFGVYIIHVNPYIWKYFFKNRYVFIAKFGTIKLAVAVVSAVAVIFTVCIFIDFLREQLFKLLRVKKIIQKAESKFLRNIW
jgi:surface polysaccharide O-acyltransferase-like enzyme